MRSEEQIWDESRLREAVLRGDETAWRVLYERTFQPLFAFVHCRMDRRSDLTTEAVQETWLVAVRRIRRFDPTRSTFETWLRGIALNVIRSHRRRENRRTPADRSLDEAAPAASTPGGRADRADLADRIARSLTLLPVRYQAVLEAHYRQRQPVAAIAAETDQSPKAVESLLVRARAAFRAAYERLGRSHEEM
jgi:RNA polymerase sigma-70 factor (ECF subfamily)